MTTNERGRRMNAHEVFEDDQRLEDPGCPECRRFGGNHLLACSYRLDEEDDRPERCEECGGRNTYGSPNACLGCGGRGWA